jgi:photosystem II stability/assembly factor-like uncharacterized protein
VVGSGAFRSADGGASWSPIIAGFVTESFAIDPRRPLWLYAAGYGFCDAQGDDCLRASIPRAASSRDGGVTWREIPRIELPVNPAANTGSFAAVRLSPVHPETVYAVGTRSFKSVNGGVNWQRLPLPSPPFTGEVAITDLALDPAAPQTLYAAGSAGQVLKSVNAGAAFAAAGALPAGVTPISLAIDPNGSHAVYAGTSSGVFLSKDGGVTWQRFETGLDPFTV